MALDHLLQALRRDADQEIAAIAEAARAEAEGIRAHAEADAATRRGRCLAQLDAERRSAVEQALSRARLEARRFQLEARERALQRVFARVRDDFPGALARPELGRALLSWLADARGALGDRPGTLRTHPALAEQLRGEAAPLEVVPDPGVGTGFLLRSSDGAVEVQGTLEDRLTRLEPRLRQAVLASLEHPE